jgi:bifunctional ADP-heptose synthase (sugar kinase/adenylyltransferase)
LSGAGDTAIAMFTSRWFCNASLETANANHASAVVSENWARQQ